MQIFKMEAILSCLEQGNIETARGMLRVEIIKQKLEEGEELKNDTN